VPGSRSGRVLLRCRVALLVYESACHEGNSGLAGILSSDRADETRAAAGNDLRLCFEDEVERRLSGSPKLTEAAALDDDLAQPFLARLCAQRRTLFRQ
jgi:hypothetical protein